MRDLYAVEIWLGALALVLRHALPLHYENHESCLDKAVKSTWISRINMTEIWQYHSWLLASPPSWPKLAKPESRGDQRSTLIVTCQHGEVFAQTNQSESLYISEVSSVVLHLCLYRSVGHTFSVLFLQFATILHALLIFIGTLQCIWISAAKLVAMTLSSSWMARTVIRSQDISGP